MIKNLQTILRVIPRNIANTLDSDNLEEIRIRINRNMILKYRDREEILEYVPTQRDILSMFQVFCDNSIYSYQNQICNGFITLMGGHRVGITGNIAMKDGVVSNINYISSLNIRIAKEILGASDQILTEVLKNGNINNTLIVSPPGCGKTTILRDLIRNLSNLGYTVSLIDERGEIAAMYKGIPQNDVGLRTDVLDNVTKALGMTMAIRSMAPQIIATDEIGSKDDIEAINYGICSGVKGIFTAHGNSIEELKLNTNLGRIYEEKIFNKIIFLEKKGIMKRGKNVFHKNDIFNFNICSIDIFRNKDIKEIFFKSAGVKRISKCAKHI